MTTFGYSISKEDEEYIEELEDTIERLRAEVFALKYDKQQLEAEVKDLLDFFPGGTPSSSFKY